MEEEKIRPDYLGGAGAPASSAADPARASATVTEAVPSPSVAGGVPAVTASAASTTSTAPPAPLSADPAPAPPNVYLGNRPVLSDAASASTEAGSAVASALPVATAAESVSHPLDATSSAGAPSSSTATGSMPQSDSQPSTSGVESSAPIAAATATATATTATPAALHAPTAAGSAVATPTPLKRELDTATDPTSLKRLRAEGFVASPSPLSSSGLENLIELVYASTAIDDNATREEISLYLRHLHQYAAHSTSKVLLSRLSWAFLLRKVDVQGEEKADFIILRAREGTYQLKRVPAASMSKIEITSSLANVSAAPVPSFSAENDKLRAENEKLAKQVKNLQHAKETTQEDLKYMQTQYQEASLAAVTRAQEATVAEKEVERLSFLLETGLKQRNAVFEGELAFFKQKAAELEGQVKLLTAQLRESKSERLYEKAARYDEFVSRREIIEPDDDIGSSGSEADFELARTLPKDGVPRIC